MRKNIYWLGVGTFITILFATFFLIVQQSFRYAANLPQRSMVQDVAKRLEDKAKPDTLVDGHIDIDTNMAPFIIIYDQYGKVVAGNGYLDGKIPQVPIGVLNAAKDHKLNSVTWQPDDKVRVAAVSAQADGYYVLGGRNLYETEGRTRSIAMWLITFWVITMAILILSYFRIHKKKNAHEKVKAEKVQLDEKDNL